MSGRTAFETACGIVGGLAGFLFGAADGLFYALIAFVALDYITGVVMAAAKRRLSSRIGFVGLAKKMMIFVLVALANIIDVQVLGGGAHAVLRSAVAAFLMANEGLSILENAAEIGLPIPPKLKSMLMQVKGKGDVCGKSERKSENKSVNNTEESEG